MAESFGLNLDTIQSSGAISFGSDVTSGSENGETTIGISGKNILWAFMRAEGNQYEEPEYLCAPFGVTINGSYYKLIVSSDAINIVRTFNGRWKYQVTWLYLK